MSKGLMEDLINTVKEISKPTGMVTGKNWLRHDGEINIIFDEKLLTGITKEQMAKILVDNKLKDSEKEALSWMKRHLNHLTATGSTESERGHKLSIIEDADGKIRFDVTELESEHNCNIAISQHKVDSSSPTREEVVKILCEIAPKGKDVDEEVLKRKIEFSFALEKRKLQPGWWEITKRNLVEWTEKG